MKRMIIQHLRMSRGEGGCAVAGMDLEQRQGVGDHVHAQGGGGEGQEGHLHRLGADKTGGIRCVKDKRYFWLGFH